MADLQKERASLANAIDDMMMRQFSATSAVDADQKLPTAEDIIATMRKALRDIGPPPPKTQYSRAATRLPSGMPQTDDMKEMVDRLGKQRIPAAYRINTGSLDVVVIHPDMMKKAKMER